MTKISKTNVIKKTTKNIEKEQIVVIMKTENNKIDFINIKIKPNSKL